MNSNAALAAEADNEADNIAQLSQSKPLNICLLGYRSHPYCGGQGIYLKYLSAALADLGHRVDVISGAPYPQLDPRVRLIKIPGMNLFDKEPWPRAFSLRPQHLNQPADLLEYFSVMSGGFPEPRTFGMRVVKYLKTHQHDYDLIHDNQSLGFGLLQLQRMGIPTVATIHHPITRDLEIALNAATKKQDRQSIKRWYSFLKMQKFVVQRLKNITTVSECSRQDIAEAFRVNSDNIHLVYNGIDTQEFRPMPQIKRNPMRLMATASADVPLKGLDYLLKAVALLAPRYPDLELLVLGQPKEDGPTAKLMNKLKLHDRVTFVKGIPTEEIVQHYAEASIAVVPSLYEGFGLPAGEAMACGVPVISTTGGALPEVVGDAGILVPTADEQAIADAIESLLKDPKRAKALGKAGREHIENNLSWSLVATQMTSYYREVLQDANR